MRPIAVRSSNTSAGISAIDLPGQRDVRGQTFLTGPGTTVIISDIDEEEAANWDRIVEMRTAGRY